MFSLSFRVHSANDPGCTELVDLLRTQEIPQRYIKGKGALNRVNRYLTSSATVMYGLKPFEDTIYIDSVPVIEYKSGTDGFLYSIR